MKRRGFFSLLAGCAVIAYDRVANAICNPHLVELLGQGPNLARARAGLGGELGQYRVRWFGHSSFAIRSGTGTRIVADPNFDVTPGIEADAVTVSNDHFTHNNIDAVGGKPTVLRGITLDQRWKPVKTKVKDILIVNLPSIRNFDYGRIANSIFVYEMGSLCIAHMGNIGHLLTPKQEKLLRRVDVMMIPIDARNNLDFPDLVKVIEQVKAPIVIPMHYDNPYQVEHFVAFLGDRYPVRRKPQSQLVLTRAALPKRTEVFVLPHPSPYAGGGWFDPDMDTEN